MKVKLLTLSLMVSMLLCGCATTTWQDTTAKTLVTVATTVDAAMKAWAIHVVNDNVPAVNQEPVQQAYVQYQVSFNIAKTTYVTAIANKDNSLVSQVIAQLQANEANLLHAVQAFGGQLPNQ